MIVARDEEVIVAQCTPQGRGAIALVRLSGVNAVAIADMMAELVSGKRLVDLPTHTIHYGRVVDANDATIDTVLFLLTRAPRTFTGQDTVEITCHNNQFVVEAVIARAIECGARLADRGEFARRGVLYGKMDLLQAEAINDLIHANSQVALKKSLCQVDGSLSAQLAAIEKQLIKALALSEGSFELSDDGELFLDDQIRTIVQSVLETLASLKRGHDVQRQLRDGIRVALIGSVNAGKSRLFNVLLCKDRSIVSQLAGTTRDTVEAGIYRDGCYCTLVDTAGLRSAADVIEQEGVRRSLAEAQLADLIVLVVDGSRRLTDDEQRVYRQIKDEHADKVIVVQNKCDLPQVGDEIDADALLVSALTGQNVAAVDQAITQRVECLLATADSPYMLNQRQYNLVLGLEKKVAQVSEQLSAESVAHELLSHHLTDAIAHVAELTGKSVSEAGLDAVFKEFCVGK